MARKSEKKDFLLTGYEYYFKLIQKSIFNEGGSKIFTGLFDKNWNFE